MPAGSLRLIKVSSQPSVEDGSFAPRCFLGRRNWLELMHDGKNTEKLLSFFFFLAHGSSLKRSLRPKGREVNEDVSAEAETLFLILIPGVILSAPVICYSVCLESAAGGTEISPRLRQAEGGSVIHHFGSALHRIFIPVSPSSSFFPPTLPWHYETNIFRSYLRLYLCTTKKGRKSARHLHSASSICRFGGRNVGDLMNNTSCSFCRSS